MIGMEKNTNCQQVRAKLEFYLEENLSWEEQQGLEVHLAECPDCAAFYARQQEEMEWLGRLLRAPIAEATRQAPFDGLWERIEAGLNISPEVAVEEETPGWMDRFVQVLVAYRTAWITALCVVGVLLVLAIPVLDPGPDPNDCIVDEAIGGKNGQVAVLQTQNRATGKRMTVIVVDETPSDSAEDETEDKPR